MSLELDKECINCGTKLKQHASFSVNNGTITIKVYRYKCPVCGALLKKPTVEEITKAKMHASRKQARD